MQQPTPPPTPPASSATNVLPDWTLPSYVSDQESIRVISDEYSIVPAQVPLRERDTEWPDSLSYYHSRGQAQSPISAAFTQSSETILSSHFALSTAYEKLKRKLAESEKENQLLRKQQILDRGQMASPDRHAVSAQSLCTTSSQSLNMADNEITKAWEAYQEKCRECEQIRDELNETRQKLQNSQQASKIQNLHEEVHREKARYSDLQQQFTSVQGSIEHTEKKELLAREELLKEKEYQQNLLAATEKKHNEMQSKINDLEQQLIKERESTNLLMRGHKEELMQQSESFNRTEDHYKEKIRILEEKNIELQEYLTASHAPMTKFNSYSSTESSTEAEMISILSEINALTNELDNLKEVSRKQRHIIRAIIDTPGIENLFKELQLSGSKYPSSTASSTPQFADVGKSDLYASPPASFSMSPKSVSRMTSEIKIKRADDFIRELNKGKTKQFGAPMNHKPSIGVQRTIHSTADLYSGSEDAKFNNTPSLSTYSNNLGHNHASNVAMQPASLPSDDGDSSMLTLQSANKENNDIEMSSDEDIDPYVTAFATPARTVQPTVCPRPDIRAKDNIVRPVSSPQPMSPPSCPVCDYKFMLGSTEAVMTRHINSHFSDDEGEFLEMPQPQNT